MAIKGGLRLFELNLKHPAIASQCFLILEHYETDDRQECATTVWTHKCYTPIKSLKAVGCGNTIMKGCGGNSLMKLSHLPFMSLCSRSTALAIPGCFGSS